MVDQAVAEEFVAGLAAKAQSLPLGDPRKAPRRSAPWET